MPIYLRIAFGRPVRFLAINLILMLPGLVSAQERTLTADAPVIEASPESAAAGLPAAPQPVPAAIEPARPAPIAPVQPAMIGVSGEAPHRFLDGENKVLFGAVGASAAADFFVTRANLANGGQELNPLVRGFSGSTAGLAANFGLETASVVAISYMFHRTGHHKLERLTSFVDIGGSLSAVGYGLAHR